MSVISDRVYVLLKEVFPYVRIEKEVSVRYKGQQLYIDFYIPMYSIAVEVNGGQHDKFIKFFHQDISGYRSQVKRDHIKSEWAETNSINLITISYKNIPRTKEELLELIKKEVLDG
jgi:very-short-patch-repair endonuclease